MSKVLTGVCVFVHARTIAFTFVTRPLKFSKFFTHYNEHEALGLLLF